ncbi:1,6-anhydro-N-acetylmuramyl-L-alanine amidase AmpD [Schauerella aestuarii]|uniref:1,6-anhydro-N-acetylmuramyl-L-alanine amidase AmpD n=1 Tax=Schauerella aestuarii TaxID=2511204 RepID=UPI0038B2D05D
MIERAVAAPGALHLDRHGWLVSSSRSSTDAIRHCPSPNHDRRPSGTSISLLVMHNISLPPGQFGGPHVAGLFTNTLDYSFHPWLERLRPLRVSAHFFVRRDGQIVQFVSADKRAWHAGISTFRGRDKCNDFSLGIEMEGTDVLPYTDAQYAALARLVPALWSRYPLSAVRGHEHIAPVRKTDPGPAFDWRRFGEVCGLPARVLPRV